MRAEVNGFLLAVPFFIIRFGLLSFLDKDAVQRAAYFAPVRGNERIAYYIYQVSNAGIFFSLFFLTIKVELTGMFFIGALLYIAGLALCAVSIADFSSSDEKGMNQNGVYRFSRNPMYVSYFICFAATALLTRSIYLAGLVLIFQGASHWIILSEERWCLKKFGRDYEEYMKRVRRYI